MVRFRYARRADGVAVMEGGRLVELGSHAELLARGERYAELWASWRGSKELSAVWKKGIKTSRETDRPKEQI